jgi:hypothetical protein
MQLLRRAVKQFAAGKGGRLTTIHDVLRELLLLPGATYSCAAVRVSGELVGEAGSEPVDPATVVRWARSAAEFLAAADDDLDDLMVTSRRSYRLVRPVDGGRHGPLLLHLCLDRTRANLAAARRELALVRLDVAPQTLPPALISATAGTAEWAPLPRRVPAAIPPPAARTLPTRAPRWPGRARPGASSPPVVLAVVPGPREPAAGRPTAAAPTAAGPRWADDVGTMRRLLAGLRALR